jgi:hypothetical protein
MLSSASGWAQHEHEEKLAEGSQAAPVSTGSGTGTKTEAVNSFFGKLLDYL